MSRIYSVRKNWGEITGLLRSDEAELEKFLRFSSGIYKYSFSDAALVYQQNPNAEKVAELSVWNQVRAVRKQE